MEHLERILALREDDDYNQTTVAEAIHVAQTTCSDYEKGNLSKSDVLNFRQKEKPLENQGFHAGDGT